ncbi:MAG: hypothetical protein HYZ85_00665 [Candidatus Omnitrophica bacterium]|nr:hypothetical protein [Candidatus Omnitrophota bacterium]
MPKARRPFRAFLSLLTLLVCLGFLPQAAAENAPVVKKQKTGIYRDIFDQNIYYEGTHLLHLERLYRKIFRKKSRAANVNVFDEVADSAFFTNRHARNRLSAEDLEKGSLENSGPDASGKLEIINGKFEGMHPGFFVRDSKGDKYLLKFDPMDYLELSTSAEIVASRFYHALGYHIPPYSIVLLRQDQLISAEGAKIYDNTGFKKALTQEKLEEYLLFLPQDVEGRYRASASKIMEGTNAGFFSLSGRRKSDPEDRIPHKDRREIRALQVFSAWLANYDVRESNTLSMVGPDGKYKYYLIDFNTALGSGTSDGKPPMTTYEYLFDYGEGLKAFFTLGLWEKPWQKKWREAGEKISASPAVGYFDNRHFDPGAFKTQLPHFAFKDLTRADAFWAAKIMMTFSDEDIRALLKAGQYSDPADPETIAKILIERRDRIAKYWFDRTNPLDNFDLRGQALVFEDLAVQYRFEPQDGSLYHVDVIGKKGGRSKKIADLEIQETSLAFQPDWLNQYEGLDLLFRTVRPGKKNLSPYVLVELDSNGITGILHQD